MTGWTPDDTRTAAEMVAANDRVPRQRNWRAVPLTDEDKAVIARLRAEHPVESCDLFRTMTGRCTCATNAESRPQSED